MPDIPASREEHLALEQRHRDFKAGKQVDRDGVRDFVLDSWLRCRAHFSAQSRPEFRILPEKELPGKNLKQQAVQVIKRCNLKQPSKIKPNDSFYLDFSILPGY